MKFAVIALLALLFIPATHAALQEWKIGISINDDRTTEWVVSYTYNESIQKSDIFLLTGITSYNVTADGVPVKCSLSSGIGSSIICNNINARIIVYNLKTYSIVRTLQSLNIFSSRFSVTQPTDRFSVSVNLPFGTTLADASKLAGTGMNPSEPSGAMQGSDGRRIFVEWIYDKPQLGYTSDYTVVYEQVKTIDFNIFLFIISAIVIAFLIFLIFFFRRSHVHNILPVLTDNERKVMEILIRDKKADQRVIVKETDFSKAKTSRIIQDLEKRGLVEKRAKGRTNIITLKTQQERQKIEESRNNKKNDEIQGKSN
jgi:uncharacterized membrane protein